MMLSDTDVAHEVEQLQRHFQKHDKIKDFPAYPGKVHSVAWNKDGRRLASGSSDKVVNTFHLDNSARLMKDHTFRGHSDSVDQLSWHPIDPDLFATASADQTVRLWDARVRKAISTIPLKGENINVTWSPNGSFLAVGNKEDLVSWIDMRTYKVKYEEQYKFEVNEMAWNRNGDAFFMTTGHGAINIYSYPSLKLEHTLHAHPANAICLQFSPNGDFFAVGSADAIVSLWDARELICIGTFARLEWPVRSLSFSHDGRMLATGSEDHFIDIAHVDTGTQIHSVNTQSSATYDVAWHPKEYLLAFSSEQKYERDRETGVIKLFGLPSDS